MSEHPMHQQFAANKRGRDFVVGDIHAMADALKSAMDAVDFDTGIDRLFSVGDFIDRGPDNLEMLELLSEPWFHAVIGNHEVLLLSEDPVDRVRHQKFGGKWTKRLTDDELGHYRARVGTLPIAMTIDGPAGTTIGVCHAEWPGKNWARVEEKLKKRKIREAMLWGRKRIKSARDQKVKGADLLIHGHTPVDDPVRLGDALFIDTGCVYGGSLTLLSIEDALAYQAKTG